jgi:5'-nucleotidase
MRILISNDDGVYSPALEVLAKELSTIAEVKVIAPDRNRSGASNSLSVQMPVRLQTLPNGYISVAGTPTDCVHLALTGLLEEKFDMVVSGPNLGANLGDDVIYSGTVAAATEGRVLGMPAIAISLVGKEPQVHFQTAATIARNLVERLKIDPLPAATILNVNVPDLPLEEIKGVEVTRLGSRHVAEPAIKALDPRGGPVYWIGPSGTEADAGQGTDFHAVNEKKVSITPLKIDMTNYTAFEKLSKWIVGLDILGGNLRGIS